jgi:hypothetical protein
VGNQEEKTFTIPKLTQRNNNAWMARVKSEHLLRECWEAIAGYEDATGVQLSQTEIRESKKILQH